MRRIKALLCDSTHAQSGFGLAAQDVVKINPFCTHNFSQRLLEEHDELGKTNPLSGTSRQLRRKQTCSSKRERARCAAPTTPTAHSATPSFLRLCAKMGVSVGIVQKGGVFCQAFELRVPYRWPGARDVVWRGAHSARRRFRSYASRGHRCGQPSRSGAVALQQSHAHASTLIEALISIFIKKCRLQFVHTQTLVDQVTFVLCTARTCSSALRISTTLMLLLMCSCTLAFGAAACARRSL